MDQQHDPTQMTQLSGSFFVIVCHFFGLGAGVWATLVELPYHLVFAPSGPVVWCVGAVTIFPLGNGHHIAFGWGSHRDTASEECSPSSFCSSLVVNTFLLNNMPFAINIGVLVPILFHCFVFSENYFLSTYSLLLSLPYQKGWEEGEWLIWSLFSV